MSQHSYQSSSGDSESSVKLDSETVNAVLLDHMKTLRSSTDWGVTIAISSMLLAVTGIEQTIIGVGFSATGEAWSYFTAAAIYTTVILVLGRQLLGLGYLLETARELNSTAGSYRRTIALVVPVITYPWFFNPFTYCGGIASPGPGQSQVDSREEPSSSGQPLQDSASGPKESLPDMLPTPPWAQELRNFSGAAGGVALILAWWAGFIGLHFIFIEIKIAPYWDAITGWLMVLTGLFAIFAIWKVMSILSSILIAGRGEKQGRLVFYEDTVLPRLASFSLVQVGMIIFCWSVLRMPSWKVLPAALIPVLLIPLAYRFKKKYRPDFRQKETDQNFE